jgi:hypothetical protein
MGIVPVGFVALYALLIRGRYKDYEEIYVAISVILSVAVVLRMLPLMLAPYVAILRGSLRSRIFLELRKLPVKLQLETSIISLAFLAWITTCIYVVGYVSPIEKPHTVVLALSLVGLYYCSLGMSFIAFESESALANAARLRASEQEVKRYSGNKT